MNKNLINFIQVNWHIGTLAHWHTCSLVPKMTHPRNHHNKSFFLTKLDTVLIPDRTARLNKTRYAFGGCYAHAIVKGKECVRCQRGTLQTEFKLIGFLNGLHERIYAAGLATTLADKLFIFYKSNSI